MGFDSRYRAETIIVATSLLYIAVGGFMNSALNNPADDINTFIRESLLRRHDVIVSQEAAAWIWSSVIFSFMVGSLAGAIMAHQLADRFGRKPTLMYYSSALYLAASIAFYLARPLGMFELLIVGRLITGVSNGIANPVLATYLVESVPLDLTGFAGSVLDFSGCIGSFLGIALSTDSVLGSPTLWHHLLGGPCLLVGALQIFTSLIFYESPKYLLLHRHEPFKAARAVQFFYGPRMKRDDIWRTLAGFADAEKDQGIKGEFLRDNHHYHTKRSRIMRHSRTLLLCAALGALPLVCGYTILLNYSAEVLQMSGMNQYSAQTYTTVMGVFEVLGSIGSLLVNYRSPRRLVLLGCTLLCLCLMTVMVLLLVLNTYFPSDIFLHTTGSLICLVASITVIGPFPLYLLLPAELTQQKLRALATSITTGAYYLISITALLIFYPAFGSIGAYSLLPFIGIGFMILPVLYWYLPETSPMFIPQEPEDAEKLLPRRATQVRIESPDSGLEDDDRSIGRFRMRSESCPLLNDRNVLGRDYGSSRSSSGADSTSTGGIEI